MILSNPNNKILNDHLTLPFYIIYLTTVFALVLNPKDKSNYAISKIQSDIIKTKALNWNSFGLPLHISVLHTDCHTEDQGSPLLELRNEFVGLQITVLLHNVLYLPDAFKFRLPFCVVFTFWYNWIVKHYKNVHKNIHVNQYKKITIPKQRYNFETGELGNTRKVRLGAYYCGWRKRPTYYFTSLPNEVVIFSSICLFTACVSCPKFSFKHEVGCGPCTMDTEAWV